MKMPIIFLCVASVFIFVVSLISSGVFADDGNAPIKNYVLNELLVQQKQTNHLLQTLIDKDGSSIVPPTDAQIKTSCLYNNKYYSSGSTIVAGPDTVRCTMMGDVPIWKG